MRLTSMNFQFSEFGAHQSTSINRQIASKKRYGEKTKLLIYYLAHWPLGIICDKQAGAWEKNFSNGESKYTGEEINSSSQLRSVVCRPGSNDGALPT